ncbi:hypothetical protein ACJX0J_035850 [Zea mays]
MNKRGETTTAQFLLIDYLLCALNAIQIHEFAKALEGLDTKIKTNSDFSLPLVLRKGYIHTRKIKAQHTSGQAQVEMICGLRFISLYLFLMLNYHAIPNPKEEVIEPVICTLDPE